MLCMVILQIILRSTHKKFWKNILKLLGGRSLIFLNLKTSEFYETLKSIVFNFINGTLESEDSRSLLNLETLWMRHLIEWLHHMYLQILLQQCKRGIDSISR